VIENIDIGGPAMVRAAAMNFASVGVVVCPARYDDVLTELKRDGALSLETRRALAAEAFAHTAAYDAAVASWFAREDEGLPSFVGSPSRRWPICGTGRTRISVARCTRRRRDPGSCSAPRC
jgi:phosphoribosylaminoimidazolecarboxamide formyltransferase/IMP cyclohydrolase